MISLSEVSNYLQSISVANYSALPAPALVPNKLYYCIASQGTPYIGILWGGNYYPSGWYRSNGVTWGYQNTAFQASLADVVAGVIQDQFVSPYTLKEGPNLDQSGSKNYASASGADTYIATITPAITAYSAGQMFHINFTNVNTGASTINLNGLGAKNIVDSAGSALSAGVLTGVVSVIYNGTNFQILGVSASVVSQTITNGVTDKAPSEDAVFDALALKLNANDASVTDSRNRKLYGYQNTDSSVTGSTSQTVLVNIKIDGGTMGANGVMIFDATLFGVGTAGNKNFAAYVSTVGTNTVGSTGVPSSSTQIGTYNLANTALHIGRFGRKLANKNSESTNNSAPISVTSNTDLASQTVARQAVNINTANDFWLVITCTLFNSGDTGGIDNVQVYIDKP